MGPVHVAKMCGEAMYHLFKFNVTKLPAATACRRRLGKFVTGGHSAKVCDTARMPPEGYEVFFARRGGVAHHHFCCLNYCLIPASSQTCHGAPKPCTCFLVWPSPQSVSRRFWGLWIFCELIGFNQKGGLGTGNVHTYYESGNS